MIRFTVARQATFVVAFTIVLGCGYDSTTPYPSPAPNPAFEDGLWTASASNPAIIHLDPSQLLADGDRTPVTAISTPSAELFNQNGIAFDDDGTMWIASQDDSVLVAFAPAALTSSGARTATTRITSIAGSLSAPTGLAFDSQHRLWVANSENGTIVRFDRAQLASGGAVAPAVTISGVGHPTALAFDAAGSLWASNFRTNKVFSFSASQLNTSGFLAPQVVINTLGTSLANPSGIAFDVDGNLWVANTSLRTLAAFSPAQLATTGSPVPHIVISSDGGSLDVPVGLAFDGDGSLWVMGSGGALEKFARTSLAATGAPSPSVRLGVTGYVLFWNVAFWPKPAGLPLN
jgi:sugar lactone lactonase YvrE